VKARCDCSSAVAGWQAPRSASQAVCLHAGLWMHWLRITSFLCAGRQCVYDCVPTLRRAFRQGQLLPGCWGRLPA